MIGGARPAPRRWTPDHWYRAQYVALAFVLAAAVVLGVLRAQALMSA